MTFEAHIEDYKILKITTQELSRVLPVLKHGMACGVFATDDFLDLLHDLCLFTNCKHKEWMLRLMATSMDNFTKREMIDRYVYIQNLCPDTQIKK
jgi:hypothetical protein